MASTESETWTKEKRQGETWVHKIKCMGCGLHFTAYSWNESWRPAGCPECRGDFEQGGYMRWSESSTDFIFQLVPGETPLAGWGA